MAADAPNNGWAPEVIKFISENLIRYPGEEGWDHQFSSAYQMGCMAIVALGQAKETRTGAIPLQNPAVPKVLPRWDDICAAVLSLANQCGKISYRLTNGDVPTTKKSTIGFSFVPVGKQPPVPALNIAANGSLGPAHAAPDVIAVLKALGLIAGERWSDGAELVFWREQPRAWEMDVISDPRFTAASQQAVKTVPGDIRNEIAHLMIVKDEDVEACFERNKLGLDRRRAERGLNSCISDAEAREKARQSLESVGRGKLDWLFFEKWRLADGWLTESQVKRRLRIFHDPLAIQMRRAVIAQLHPECPAFSE